MTPPAQPSPSPEQVADYLLAGSRNEARHSEQDLIMFEMGAALIRAQAERIAALEADLYSVYTYAEAMGPSKNYASSANISKTGWACIAAKRAQEPQAKPVKTYCQLIDELILDAITDKARHAPGAK